MQKDNCQAYEDCPTKECKGKLCGMYRAPIMGRYNPELLALERALPALIDAEQDGVASGFLVDVYDAVQGYLRATREKDEREFKEDEA